MTGFAELAALTDNSLSYPEARPFAAILGANPSRGARSPMLWNAAFEAHGIDAQMLPVDVSEQRLSRVLEVLDANPHFLGGAIAVPHKEPVARWLGARVSAEAAEIGAVNCLYREKDGRLAGTNTDGEGALRSCEERFGKLAGKRVVLLGLGGAGKAVAAFFRRAVDPGGRLTLCGRSSAGQEVASRLSADWRPWAELSALLPNADCLVNCTSVGSGALADASPLSAEQLELLPKTACVFDIVYQPTPTKLMSLASARGLAVLDGSEMNLGQAILAYGYAAPAPKGVAATRLAMEAAKARLG
jgi:shikimate dehydrogenase